MSKKKKTARLRSHFLSKAVLELDFTSVFITSKFGLIEKFLCTMSMIKVVLR